MTGAKTAKSQGVALELSGVRRAFGDLTVIGDLSLSIPAGEFLAILGPSGCGKSTLLRVLNRIYEVYPHQRAEGRVLMDGEDILSRGQDLNLLRAKVGMVFQKPTPFPMSIYENIAFGVPREAIDMERVVFSSQWVSS